MFDWMIWPTCWEMDVNVLMVVTALMMDGLMMVEYTVEVNGTVSRLNIPGI